MYLRLLGNDSCWSVTAQVLQPSIKSASLGSHSLTPSQSFRSGGPFRTNSTTQCTLEQRQTDIAPCNNQKTATKDNCVTHPKML